MFLDGFNFEKLIHPYKPDQFFSEYFEQKPLLIKRADPDYYEGLLRPKDLDDIFFHWPNSLSTVSAEENDGNRTSLGSNTFQRHTQSVLKELDEGHSVILDSLDNRHPPLSQLCALLEKEHTWTYQTNIYITPSSSQGFKTHADSHNVFILQTSGSKDWRVNLSPTDYDLRSGDNKSQKIDETAHLSLVLEQGDLLYIPKEFAHDAVAKDTSSVHITLSPHPPSRFGLLYYLMKESRRELTDLERSLPHNYLDQSVEQLGTEVRKWLLKLTDHDHSEVLKKYFEKRNSDFRGLFFGALEQRIDPAPINVNAMFISNPFLIMKTETSDSDVLISTPDKVVDMPLMFEEQIKFCLSGEVFTGAEIPGMSADEQMILLNRLMGEGLIVSQESAE